MPQHRLTFTHRSEPEPAAERAPSGKSKSMTRTLLLAALAGAAGLTVALTAVASADGTPPWVRTAAVEKADTVRAGDRRCLTRRPEDCLARPVPVDEPHGAVCGVCHDLWADRPLVQTARSCSGGECHAHPETLTPFHRTVDRETLDKCITCHRPHDFRVAGGSRQCAACHERGGSVADGATTPAPLALPARLGFDHDDHAGVACAACHGESSAHGTLKLRDIEGCRSCHHTPPESSNCTRCHLVDEVRGISVEVTRSLDIHVGSLDGPRRTIGFDHAKHWETDCAVCHTGGSDLGTAPGADCSGCHLNHHDPTADCSACHAAPAAGAHTRAVHMGCGGTGCHDPLPEGIRDVPRTRQLCLACHRDRAEHEPDRNCVDCHVLPPVPTPGT